MSLLKLFLFLFPAIFIFFRQYYLNLFGLDRIFLSTSHILILYIIGFFSILISYNRKFISNENLLFFLLTLVCFFLGYFTGDREITYSQFAVGFFIYSFLIPCYFIYPAFRNFFLKNKNTLLIILIILFLQSFFVSLLQFLGTDEFFLFATDSSVSTKKSFSGQVRVNGLYGNFVDYAFLAFVVFLLFWSRLFVKNNKKNLIMAILSFIAICLTLTRLFIFSAVAVVLLTMILQIKKFSFSRLLFFSTSGILLFYITQNYFEGFFGLLISSDAHTQSSNLVRLNQFTSIPSIISEHFFSGTGPGFLLGPNEDKKLFIRDGLFFQIIMELGFVLGSIYILILLRIIIKTLIHSYNNFQKNLFSKVTFFICLGFIFSSTINSYFALPTSYLITMFILGAYNYENMRAVR